MSYGVNKWASTSTRARSAGKRKKSARRPAKKSSRRSARAAPKKRARSSSRRSAPKKRAAPKRATRRAPKKRAPKKRAAPKAKKFTRYDPYSGRKVSVTEDDPRFTEYLERKPSAQQRKANKLLDRPLETIQEEVTKDVSRKVASRVQAQVRRTTSGVAKGVGAAITASPISRVLPALGAVGALAAAGILGGWLMDRAGAAGRLPTLGDRLNELSRNFVEAQRALQHKTGAASWQQVPQGPRDKLVAEYKAAIAQLSRLGERARYSPVRTF